jgi:quercetin dioxygenase-like cupin family protein
MERRTFIKSAVTSSLLVGTSGVAAAAVEETGSTLKKGIYVASGQDRAKQPMHLGQDRVDAKVTTRDSNGGLYAVEGNKVGKGGPPRHVHHEQDEWFYVIEGEFRFEIGDDKFTARPGDSLFAPRKIPHAWALVGDRPGTLLTAVSPAGTFEAFIHDTTNQATPPTPEEMAKAFAAHGMTVVGPPLEVD